MVDYNKPVIRNNILEEYRSNHIKYLKTLYPTAEEHHLKEFVTRVMKKDVHTPKVDLVRYPSVGNMKEDTSNLLEITKELNNKTISPSGTFFETSDINVPHIVQFIINNTNLRKKYKKEMFTHIENGNMEQAESSNFEQASAKIKNNGLSGALGADTNAFYDPESYNATTSLARYSTISCYVISERFLASNFYFNNTQDIINFLITTSRLASDKENIMNVVNKHNLRTPLPCDILDMISHSTKNYLGKNKTDTILRLNIEPIINNMQTHERVFIFYYLNYYNLFTFNSDKFSNFIKSIENLINLEVDTNIDTNLFNTIDDDLLQMCMLIHSSILEGNSLSHIRKEREDILKRIITICLKAQSIIDEIKDIVKIFLTSKSGVSNALKSKSMLREAILASDTDSVIFTVIKLARWYNEVLTNNDTSHFLGSFYKPNNKTKIKVKSIESRSIYGVTVYFLSKMLASLLKIVSHNRGCVGEKNLKNIKIKNEYFYPSMIRTNKSKHYTGKMTIQEGIPLPKPKVDIKGVHFKNSAVPKTTADITANIICSIMDEVEEHGDIYAGDYVIKALQYEESILDNINNGHVDYFPNISIKNRVEYVNPNSSIYFNYLVWKEVFGKSYGDITIGSKASLLPLVKGAFKSNGYRKYLEETSPEISQRLEKFLSTLDPKKNINRLPISGIDGIVPKELIPIIDKRKIIFKNSVLMQLPLKSLLVDLGDKKKMPLFIDYYSDKEV